MLLRDTAQPFIQLAGLRGVAPRAPGEAAGSSFAGIRNSVRPAAPGTDERSLLLDGGKAGVAQLAEPLLPQRQEDFHFLRPGREGGACLTFHARQSQQRVAQTKPGCQAVKRGWRRL